MEIIFDMNVTDVIIFGILQHLTQNVVQVVHANPPTGIRKEYDNS